MGKIYDATAYERMYENYLTRYNEAKNKENWFELMIRRAKEIIKYCKTYKGSYLAAKEAGNDVYQSYYVWYLRSKDEVAAIVKVFHNKAHEVTWTSNKKVKSIGDRLFKRYDEVMSI